MASKQAHKRLTKEYLTIQTSPTPYIIAKPREDNILEWHYVITGPEDSPYFGGEYWGKIIFPSDYPFKPPQIRMMTPNGRFQPDTRLCLSMSDYHPDTWNPAWSVSTILTGLLSFMLESTRTTGSVDTTDAQKKMYAKQSAAHNKGVPLFCDLFPEIARRENPLVEPNYSDQQNEKNSLKHRNKQQTMDPNEKQKSDETLISSSSTSKTHKPLGHQIGYALLTIIVLVCILVAVKIAQKI